MWGSVPVLAQEDCVHQSLSDFLEGEKDVPRAQVLQTSVGSLGVVFRISLGHVLHSFLHVLAHFLIFVFLVPCGVNFLGRHEARVLDDSVFHVLVETNLSSLGIGMHPIDEEIG